MESNNEEVPRRKNDGSQLPANKQSKSEQRIYVNKSYTMKVKMNAPEKKTNKTNKAAHTRDASSILARKSVLSKLPGTRLQNLIFSATLSANQIRAKDGH